MKNNNFTDFSLSLELYIIFKYLWQEIKNYLELKKNVENNMDGYAADMFLYTQRTKFIIFNFFSKLYNFIKFIVFDNG